MKNFNAMIGKFKRFLRNPRPYFAVMQRRFFGTCIVIKIYRLLVLPLIFRRIRRKVQLRNRINVVFLAMTVDMWKYDGVYRRMHKDPRFNPIVVTAMRNVPQMETRLQEQEAMVECFSKRGYEIVRGYDAGEKQWVELGELDPDIVFYTQPYDGVIESRLEYFHNLGSLICYSPYAFLLGVAKWNWDSNLVQYCWKVFYASEFQLQVSESLSRVGRSNTVAAGYCFEEDYQECEKDRDAAEEAWRHDGRKRVIWAPHHSIESNELFKVSSFLEISDLMVQLRNEYKEKIMFAFKPHPVLKTKLYKIWGVEKTDAYYNDWAKAGNSFYTQGDYLSLFAGSDGMIHCSGSFIIEYLYTGKPVAYVYSKARNPPDIGQIGNAALGAHYPLHSELDVRSFIDNVILKGQDSMGNLRKETANKYLRPPNGKTFSENVCLDIVEGLDL